VTDAIIPEPAQRLDTFVEDASDGTQALRSDYAGTAWYGGKPSTGGGLVSYGTAQISTPFWLPDSHLYDPDKVDDLKVQATASLQSVYETCRIISANAALGDDPSGAGGLRVYMAVVATGRVPVGIAYRVTVLSRVDALAKG
jgi:hypothetical protein